MNISIIGLGYVGLPAAIAFHDAGFNVTGIDISETTISSLKLGILPINDPSFTIPIPITSDRWTVTNNYNEIIKSKVIIITVPTPVNSQGLPDLSFIKSAVSSIFENISNDDAPIIVLESTVFPGVSREIFTSLSLEYDLESGMDFHFAYSPERINPGVFENRIENTVRIIGSDDIEVGNKLVEIYDKITTKGAQYVGVPEVAEASKLIENVQRDVDIALTNEFAILFPKIGLDVEDVFSAAQTKWNFHRHTPGIGVGGHCIPVDPYYYLHLFNKNFPQKTSIVKTTRNFNEKLPKYYADKIISKINTSNNRVLILGYAYKSNIGDYRTTPVHPLVNELIAKDVLVKIYDPHINSNSEDLVKLYGKNIFCNAFPKSEFFDMIVLATDHDIFNSAKFFNEIANICPNKLFFDGRRVKYQHQLLEKGWSVYGVGLPE